MYIFCLPIVLSVPLRYTDSDYPFGIFKLFLQCSSSGTSHLLHPGHRTAIYWILLAASLIMISFSTNQQKTFKSSYFKICTQLIEHNKCATKIILFSFLQSVMAKPYLLKIKYLYLFIILFSLAIH